MEVDNRLLTDLNLTNLNIKDLLLLLKITDELEDFFNYEEIEVI